MIYGDNYLELFIGMGEFLFIWLGCGMIQNFPKYNPPYWRH